MNQVELLKQFLNKDANPREIALQILKGNNNPIIGNLIKMADNGDFKGVETVARNIFKEQGRDFDNEMAQLKNILNNPK